jgi:hypothetical protein
MNASRLNRRSALRTLAAGAVGAVASASWVDSLSALARQQAHAHAADAVIAAQDWTPRVLNAHQNDTVIALTELIIPQTDTPGAKAARVNRFVDMVLHGAPAADREAFLRGLAWIDERSRALYKSDFTGASVTDQTALLTALATAVNPNPVDEPGVRFFHAIKSMTITGYYTTEIGLRQELGDSGQLFLPQFQGCDHPEHQ